MEKTVAKIIYKDEGQPKYINGSFGGLNSKGEFIMHLFCETLKAPEESEIVIDNKKPSEKFREGDVKIVKYVESSVVMSQKTALSIYEWIGRNLGIEKENKEE